ncbi:hypothetical protein D3C87_1636260 [compost metagenome]
MLFGIGNVNGFVDPAETKACFLRNVPEQFPHACLREAEVHGLIPHEFVIVLEIKIGFVVDHHKGIFQRHVVQIDGNVDFLNALFLGFAVGSR